MFEQREQVNRLMLRARDAIDRDYYRPLDIPSLARIACTSEAHFIRSFKRAFGETPHHYLKRRRIERAMHLLRSSTLPVTEVCAMVGFESLGPFSTAFRALVGCSPTEFRRHATPLPVPGCFMRRWAGPA
ncbi:AraC family transcriptional regulator [Tepidiforma sp.]|uniref:AraC family transcriptional regulator n=1 Tax=Tepidiforma sp. TaxID=2682230 RepID=UPI002ADE1074|nr:AraC family transcriptional regulator [Tepidiforma sp.]